MKLILAALAVFLTGTAVVIGYSVRLRSSMDGEQLRDHSSSEAIFAPELNAQRIVVAGPSSFQLHSYLVYFDGRFWCMWSRGRAFLEDDNGQLVVFSTSEDGRTWTPPQTLALPAPQRGMVARGFWVVGRELYALVAQFRGPGVFSPNDPAGKDLQLMLYRHSGSDQWVKTSMVFRDTLNNFPPLWLGGGHWLMTARDAGFNASVMESGEDAFGLWTRRSVVGRYDTKELTPDEPVVVQPARDRLVMMIRNNARLRALFRTESADGGKSWTPPVATDVPSAPSKFFLLKTSRGDWLAIGNFDPVIGRKRLHVALLDSAFSHASIVKVSLPGQVQGKEIPSVQYPHAIEHDGNLYVVYSRSKTAIELAIIPMPELERVLRERPAAPSYIELVCRYWMPLCRAEATDARLVAPHVDAQLAEPPGVGTR
jgi:hypothetical protein